MPNIKDSYEQIYIDEVSTSSMSHFPVPFKIIHEIKFLLGTTYSAGTSGKNIQFLLEPRVGSSKMWFKVKWSPVEINTEARVSSLSAEFDKTIKMPSNFQTKITDIPDDVLLMIFLMLPPKDLIRLKIYFFT